jgi:hypothetical protein
MVNEIKSNLQTRFESFAKFVDKCLWSVKAENISTEELLKQPKFKNSLSADENCDVDCYELF